MSYLIGRRLRFTVKITELATGLAVDPDNLTLTFRDPVTATLTVYEWPTGTEIVQDGVGEFHCDETLPGSGTWWYRWSAEGSVEEAAESYVQIAASRVL